MLAPDKIPDEPEEAHFQISQRAAEALGRLVEGNGLKAEQVRLARHETLVHQVPGFVQIELVPEILTQQHRGNLPRGKAVLGQEVVEQEAAALLPQLAVDETVLSQLVEQVSKDDGRGFGMKAFQLKLQAGAAEYSMVRRCPRCNGAAAYNCARCSAQTTVVCGGCNGQGAAPCQQCHGSGQYQRGDGQRVSCLRCNGQGRMICQTCNGQRRTKCPLCNGLGRTPCDDCNRTGFLTDIYSLSFRADGKFQLDRQQVPQNVLDIIDKLGVRRIATQKLVQVFRIGVSGKDRVVTVPLLAFLPIAQAEFTIEGKPYAASIAGLPGVILSIPPLLDNAVKPGLGALYKLSKGPMATGALIEQACKYRLVRQTLTGLTHHPKRQVFAMLQKEYPVGLSEKYAKAAVQYADRALLAMGRTPRLQGLALGTLAAGAIAAAYFFYVRAQLNNPAPALDFAVWGLGFGAAFMIIRLMAAEALKNILPDSLKTAEKGLPSAGEQGYYAIATTLVAWLAAAVLAPAAHRPFWVAQLLKALGLASALHGG
jgi:hypothetical protein